MTSNDAPERIWIEHGFAIKVTGKPCYGNPVSYVRADLAVQPAEAGRVEKLLSKLIYVIEKNIKDDGSDVKTVILPDGTKHTGPICDLFHAVLIEIASQCRAALTTPPVAPVKGAVTVDEMSGGDVL